MKKEARITFSVNVNVSVDMWVKKDGSKFEVTRIQNVTLPSVRDVSEAIFNDDIVAEAFDESCTEVLGPLDIEGGEEE